MTSVETPFGREPMRLVIVDDHPLSREALWDMLADEPDLEIVGEARNGLEALELCRQTRPDLALMDLRMPHMDGLETTRMLKQEHPEISVLVITMHENPDYLLEALRAGAAGYILKDATYEDVMSAIRRISSGDSPLAPKLAVRLLRRLATEVQGPAETLSESSRPKLPQPLSPRELEVLELLALGKTNREIARDLAISAGTVKSHVEHLITKLGVSDRI